MTVSLLDANLLIALAWPSHIHHAAAHAWFARSSERGWATCPLTQCAFVRISSNPTIIPEAVSPGEAASALRRIVTHRDHVFWPDDIGFLDSALVQTGLLIGHRQVTDAYLVGLAASKGGKLATLDKKILSLLPSESAIRELIEVVPVA
ncbi:MAG: VapC toxin family PIN domain ribonuclease [Chloroflexi bacterium]|nr:VapC toxin family PIN domain ribonuclease [Chloroflexota bacterium]